MRSFHLCALIMVVSSTIDVTSALAQAPPAPNRTYVVLPVEGGSVLPPLRASLEDAVRRALQRTPHVQLQSAEDTAAILDDAARGGLACSLESVDCAARIGVIAGATHVLLSQIAAGRRLTLSSVDVSSGAAHTVTAVIALPSDDGGASTAALVDDLLAGRARPQDPPATTTTITSTTGPSPVAPPVATDAPPSALVVAGSVAAIAGGVVAVGAGVGAGIVEVYLGQPRPGVDDNAGTLQLGRGLLIATAAGAFTALVGGALLAVEVAQ